MSARDRIRLAGLSAVGHHGVFDHERRDGQPFVTDVVLHLDAGPADGPVVILLHGLGGTNASMLPLLWELATDHRVLAPDLPGFGGSAKPHARYDARWFVQWLTSFMDEVGVERYALRVVAGAGRDDAAGPLLVGEPGDADVRAPQLEAEDGL